MNDKARSKWRLRRYAFALACVLAVPVWVAAQSSDLNLPTPVGASEIEGRIAPRDLGDPRLTSHFYTFNGTQGDLILTVESDNLDGAIDLFLAHGVRPLTQVTLYGGIGATGVTKSVFLRQAETLVLRVQARTPNDADGTYRIRLGGTFQPAPNAAANPSSPTESAATNRPPAKSAGRGTHRVNAVGARIEEPAPETSAKSEPSETETKPATRTNTRTRPARRGRPAARTETARKPAPASAESSTNETAKPETAETTAPTESAPTGSPPPEAAPPPNPAPTRSTRTPRRRNTRPARSGQTAQRTNEPAKETTAATTSNESSTPQVGATHLVIETKDGTKLEHHMSEVSRADLRRRAFITRRCG